MTPTHPEPLTGQCLCGAIRFAIKGPLGPIGHCHCRTCQKGQGAAFATTARVARANFEWTAGESLLRAYESTPGKKRSFCSRCGAKLLAAWDDQDELILRLGALDQDPGGRPLVHIWTDDCRPWLELKSDLPTLPEAVHPPRPPSD